MTGKKSAVVKKAKEWLQHADEDLRLAKHAFKLKTSTPFKLIAYHAQQCAEKCRKAYLVYHEIDFPFTHNISALLELCPVSEDWVAGLEKANILSAYAITARYPGTYEVTKRDAVKSIELAEQVRLVIRRVLKKDGMKMA
jgi:HEPN domain-containing protein